MAKKYYIFTDVLEDGPIEVDGLKVDTYLSAYVFRNNLGEVDIDSWTLGERELRVVGTSGDYVIVEIGRNGRFWAKVEKVLNEFVLKQASELPEDKWREVELDSIHDIP